MSSARLLLRNLHYHWRGNLAVLLGVAVGTAVLTGALLVGDSLRGSLRDLTLERLGWVDHALVTGRFFREALAGDVPAGRVSPGILLQGAATAHGREGSQDHVRRAQQVTVLAVDDRFWPAGQAPGGTELWRSDRPEVVVNAALAGELNVGAGDVITLHVQKADNVPRESLLGRRRVEDVLDQVRVKVRQVVPNEGLGRFSLNPAPGTPRNAFVPLPYLQGKLDKKGRVNALLAGDARGNLSAALRKGLTLEDWGLVLQTPDDRARHEFQVLAPRGREGALKKARWTGRVAAELAAAAKDGVLTVDDFIAYYRRHHPYLNVESRQMFLEPAVVAAATEAASRTGLRTAPTLIYLADRIADGPQEIPYAVVAALNPAEAPPLGPFLPTEVSKLGDDEIVLADWQQSPLKAKAGDMVTLSYFQPDAQGRLEPRRTQFRLRGLVPMQDAADDPDLTPAFPGITDKLEIGQWENPPFPYDPRRVKARDEDYWKRYRTTPKAYLNLAKGQELWGSRFGQLTSIRLAPPGLTDGSGSADLAGAALRLKTELLARLDPEAGGFVFDDVRRHGLDASAGGTDFGALFLGFSVFLIVAALLLVGLLFRLNIDRRAAEVGLLLATGYRRGKVRRLLLGEGAVLAAVGGVLGGAAAVLYAWLLLDFLTASWPGGLEGSFLRLHVTPWSFVMGYVAALVVSLLTIFWTTRLLSSVPASALLAGVTTSSDGIGGPGAPRWSLWVLGIACAGAVASLIAGGLVTDHEAKAGSFFTSGLLLLTACLAGVWAWMRGSRHRQLGGHGPGAVMRLGIRNASRHAVRSLLTVGLLAAAAFVVIAMQSFHRDPGRDFLERDGGSGGFALLAESDVPLYQDLNTPKGREQLNLSDKAQKALQGVEFYSFRVRAGDDASCLNLYQPRRPRLFGVPQTLVNRGGFRFAATEANTQEEKANPWLLLNKPQPGGAIPVFGEANTVSWQLQSGLGRELEATNDRGDKVTLRIVGLLLDSVFQGELLLSDDNFLKLYPRQEGFSFFLIAAPADRMVAVKDALETGLADHGFALTSTAGRLEAFLAVENTYILTFQALGGLGLLLGALGLAVVLLRSVWERRGELALLRALGFRRSTLSWLVLAENSYLLLLGLAVGTAAALASVAPYLLTGRGGEMPWLSVLGLLGLVFLVGLAAGAIAVAFTLRAPVLQALRRE
jgi:ABC-type antimicrobial peptide transport system permease subunit